MEVNVHHRKGVEFEVHAGNRVIISDQPPANGGEDRGMTPPELMLASLGTCAGFYAAQYLKTRHLSLDGLSVKVEAQKASGPARLSSFRIELTTSPLEDRHREGVLRAVKNCLIHNTLLNPPQIETVVTAVAPSTAV
jgi:uncharacterized OsmC-like protein